MRYRDNFKKPINSRWLRDKERKKDRREGGIKTDRKRRKPVIMRVFFIRVM